MVNEQRKTRLGSLLHCGGPASLSGLFILAQPCRTESLCLAVLEELTFSRLLQALIYLETYRYTKELHRPMGSCAGGASLMLRGFGQRVKRSANFTLTPAYTAFFNQNSMSSL